MRLKESSPNRVQIRVAEVNYDKTGSKNYKVAKGRNKSMILYEATLEEVWDAITQAIERKVSCQRTKE